MHTIHLANVLFIQTFEQSSKASIAIMSPWCKWNLEETGLDEIWEINYLPGVIIL